MLSLRSITRQYGYDESTVRQWKSKGMPFGNGIDESITRNWIVGKYTLPIKRYEC